MEAVGDESRFEQLAEPRGRGGSGALSWETGILRGRQHMLLDVGYRGAQKLGISGVTGTRMGRSPAVIILLSHSRCIPCYDLAWGRRCFAWVFPFVACDS
jgi:hypothetical protein